MVIVPTAMHIQVPTAEFGSFDDGPFTYCTHDEGSVACKGSYKTSFVYMLHMRLLYISRHISTGPVAWVLTKKPHATRVYGIVQS